MFTGPRALDAVDKKLVALIATVVLSIVLVPCNAWAEQPLALKVLNYEAFGGAELQTYMMAMKQMIRSRWHPAGEPAHATKVFFQVFSDGSLLQHSIEESSGDTAYDDQAKSVIEGCAFGPPPPGSVRLMNIVAKFGTDSGSAAGLGAATESGANPTAATGEQAAAGDSNASPKAPLQGETSATGLQSSTSSSPAPRMLTAEASETGQYAAPALQGQAMAAPAPMYQAQVGMMPPPMFQAQTGMQAPYAAAAQMQQPPMFQSSVQHGQMTVGVLGCEFGLLNNQIRQIMPGSDLLRYGIVPGDIIEAADGQRLRGKDMQAYIRGTPGTYVQLTILHQGRMVTVPVMRKDTREFSNYNGYFRKWADREKFW